MNCFRKYSVILKVLFNENIVEVEKFSSHTHFKSRTLQISLDNVLQGKYGAWQQKCSLIKNVLLLCVFLFLLLTVCVLLICDCK